MQTRREVVIVEPTGLAAKQVEGSDNVFSHLIGTATADRIPARSACLRKRGHRWLLSKVFLDDDLATVKAVKAWSFVALDLEQLEHSGLFIRGPHDPKSLVCITEHEAGGVDVEELDATGRRAGASRGESSRIGRR